MDLTQLSQMVNWMDEERRRDKAELVRLEQRLTDQTKEMTEQAKRLQDLEGRLTSVQAQLVRLSQVEKALEQFKNEVTLLLKQYEERSQQAEREAALRGQVDRDAQIKAMNEIKKELQSIPRYDDEFRAKRAEEQRLSELVLRLQQDIIGIKKDKDDRESALSYLKEQGHHNVRRIAELQQEITEILKRTESQASKMQLIEEVARRNEGLMSDLREGRDTSKRDQQRFVESQQLAEQQRQRQMSEWTQEFDAQRRRMEGYANRVQAASEQSELARQALASLQQFEDRLKREQNQVAELQRLAEERHKREWAEWQAENEKHWKRHELERKSTREDQRKYEAAQATRLAQLETLVEENCTQVEALWRIEEAYASHRAAETQNWVRELEKRLRKPAGEIPLRRERESEEIIRADRPQLESETLEQP